ncbi:MAG: PASTA domain-containing protein [Marivibrio sp.]|uniref:PASTA domain-containing protein n=1 Tax=Marivibrio sp. TaxID=2039719 RepID=UPI0032EEF85D
MSARQIRIALRLVDEAGKGRAGVALAIQLFHLQSGRWITIHRATSARDGRVVETVRRAMGAAQALRAVENGGGRRVVAEGARMATADNRQTLIYDFGEVEWLDDEAFDPAGLLPETRGKKRTLAALPRRRDVAIAESMRVNMQLKTFKHGFKFARGGGRQGDDDQAETAATAEEAERTMDTPTLLQHKDQLISLTQLNQAKLSNQLGQIEAQLEQSRQLLSNREQQIKSLQSVVERERAQREEAASKAESLEQQLKGEVQIDSLQDTLVSSLSAAAKPNRKAGFKLGRVQVNLKAMVGGAGARVMLPTGEMLKQPGAASALSDIHLEYFPDDAAAEDDRPARDPGTLVPDLTGLTESAAQRVLSSVGLQAQPALGRTDAAGVAVGQAFRQAPAAGTPAPKGTAVMVVFKAPDVSGQG